MQILWTIMFLCYLINNCLTWNKIKLKNNALPFFLQTTDVCLTKNCHKSAATLIESLNKSVDPCEDFYEFACSGWISKHHQKAPWSQWEPVTEQVERHIQNILEENNQKETIRATKIVRQMYQSCIHMNQSEEENIVAVIKLLEQFGGWPILANRHWRNSFPWYILATKINSNFNIHPLLKFHVSPNLYNTSTYILYIEPPSFAIPHWILSNPLLYEEELKSYENWIVAIVLEIAQKLKISNITITNIQKAAAEIVIFEMQVANLVPSSIKTEDENHITNLYKMMHISQLKSLWNWQDILNVLFENSNLKINEDHDDTVIIKDLSYIKKLSELLQDTDPVIVANYIGWNIVKYFSRDTTELLSNYSLETDQMLFNTRENISRETFCANNLLKQMNLIIGHEYIKKYLNEEIKKNVEAMIRNIKLVLIDQVKMLNWLDISTQKRALEKAEAVTYIVAHPDYFTNLTYIDDYYKDLHITNNHVQNIIQWNKFTRKTEFQNFRNIDKNNNFRWFRTVTEVNAFYSVLHNSVIIPSGLLQAPFYDTNRIDALNYGAIGTILGHEFSHAFDNTGRQADKNGNFKQWWSDESLNKYYDILKCLNKHYNKHIEKLFEKFHIHNRIRDIEIVGQRYQDENIADIIGLKLAYKAYSRIQSIKESFVKLPGLDEYNNEQLFFISFANQWCEVPTLSKDVDELMANLYDTQHNQNKIRILGILSNSEEFSRAFKCSKEKSMNPKHKCPLW